MRIALLSTHAINPQRSAGERRVWAIMQQLLAWGHEIGFGHFGISGAGQVDGMLPRGVGYLGCIPESSERIEGCDTLYLTHLWDPLVLRAAILLLELVRERSNKRTRIVFDVIDDIATSFSFLEPDPRSYARAVDRLYGLADKIVVVAEHEKKKIIDRGARGPDQIVVVTTPEQLYWEGMRIPFDSRAHMCFVGSLSPLNVQGLKLLSENILPSLIDQLPESELRIIGSIASSAHQLVPQGCRHQVKMVGTVEDIRATVAGHRLQLVPVVSSQGIKGELLESLACGTPVVTTSAGVYGLGATHGQEVLIADQAESFLKCTVALYRDADLWHRLQQGGAKFVQERFSMDVMRTQLRMALDLPAAS